MQRFIQLGLAALAVALLVLGSARGAAAHANYERSDPPANAILTDAPSQVRVWFSEEPEPRFSELQVFDASRRRVDRDDLTAVPGDGRALMIDLQGGLAPGTYTVVWKTLSTVDGHPARGAFPFTVGADQTPAPMVLPPGADLAATPITPWSVTSRWLTLLTSVLLAGAFLFLPLVLGSSLRAIARGEDAAAAPGAWGAGRRRGLRLTVGIALAALVVGVYALLVQAGSGADVPPWAAFGAPLATILGTRYSLIWGVRMLAVAALGALAWHLQRPGVTARHRGWWAGLALGAVLLFTQSLNSHGAAAQQGTAAAVAVDWVHLVATAIWIGGLVQLAVALPAALGALGAAAGGRLLAAVIPRFSVWALGAVGALVITGLYQTWLEVGGPDALTATPYGQTLLAKIALLLPLLALGGANLLVFSPRVAKAAERSSRAAVERLGGLERGFRLAVLAEVVLGVVILGVVGLLTSLEPARDAIREQGVVQTTQVGDLRAVVRVAPGEAGLNTFDVALSQAGQPVSDAQRVTLRFNHEQMDMGVSELPLQSEGDGHYRAVGGTLSMTGPWDVQVIVRRAGRDDEQGAVTVTATDAGAARAQGGAAAGGGAPPTRLIVGGVITALGVLFLVDAIRPSRRRRRPATVALGCVAATVGLVLATAAALYPTGGDAVIANPVPRTEASIARGRELFQQNCVICHGLNARGDGPLAASLNPRPADLRVHVAQHTEGQLWLWLSDGFPGSAMPAFRTTLSDEDRWNIINYLESQYGSQAGSPQTGDLGAASPR
ncbi:MAG TPA: FixH family protein [Chloroflexota bacterium]|nr:FixH family protein [Chloroflexota bacterium]